MAASLRLQVAFACVVLLAAASAASTPPAVHERVMTVPPASGEETPSQWASRHQFHLGSVLDFTPWNGSVLLVRAGDYDRCAGNLFALQGHGVFFFIGGEPGRCEGGQRMVVRVATTEEAVQGPATAAPDLKQRLLTISGTGPLLAASSPAPSPTQMGLAGLDPSNGQDSTKKIVIIVLSMMGALGVFMVVLVCMDWRRARATAKKRAIRMTAITSAKYEPMDSDCREGGMKQCVICVDEFNDQDTLGVLPCKHHFHHTCIRQWIKVGVQPYCPICKVEV